MNRKFFIVMAVFWGLFLLFVLATRGPWWLALIAAVFLGINIWRTRHFR